MRIASALRTVATPVASFRLLLGWGAFGILLIAHRLLAAPLPAAALVVVLALIVAVIVVCAFGVVDQAEHLARRLGDPYGTLVLTLSIVLIEVILISAVMLGPGDHATIARDSVMAVAMIILNLVIGVALIVGGRRHDLRPNATGVSAYLSVLVALSAVAFALPGAIGAGGAYTAWQAIPVAGLTVVLYGFFLARQLGAQRADFQEVAFTSVEGVQPRDERPSVRATIVEHRTEIIARAAMLILTVIPIVLLSHDMGRHQSRAALPPPRPPPGSLRGSSPPRLPRSRPVSRPRRAAAPRRREAGTARATEADWTQSGGR